MLADYMARARIRFFAKTKRAYNGCLLWIGTRNRNGYGTFRLSDGGPSKKVIATRFAFFLRHGHWPIRNAIHSCDIPACVEVDHLSDDTQSKNMVDSVVRGRRKRLLLDAEKVRDIRRRYQASERPTDIARAIGVQKNVVFGVVYRRSWGHVT